MNFPMEDLYKSENLVSTFDTKQSILRCDVLSSSIPTEELDKLLGLFDCILSNGIENGKRFSIYFNCTVIQLSEYSTFIYNLSSMLTNKEGVANILICTALVTEAGYETDLILTFFQNPSFRYKICATEEEAYSYIGNQSKHL